MELAQYTSRVVAEGVKRIKAIAADIGRDPDSLDFTAFGTEQQWKSMKDIWELELAGATRVVLWLNGQDLKSILREVEDLAHHFGLGEPFVPGSDCDEEHEREWLDRFRLSNVRADRRPAA